MESLIELQRPGRHLDPARLGFGHRAPAALLSDVPGATILQPPPAPHSGTMTLLAVQGDGGFPIDYSLDVSPTAELGAETVAT